MCDTIQIVWLPLFRISHFPGDMCIYLQAARLTWLLHMRCNERANNRCLWDQSLATHPLLSTARDLGRTNIVNGEEKVAHRGWVRSPVTGWSYKDKYERPLSNSTFASSLTHLAQVFISSLSFLLFDYCSIVSLHIYKLSYTKTAHTFRDNENAPHGHVLKTLTWSKSIFATSFTGDGSLELPEPLCSFAQCYS